MGIRLFATPPPSFSSLAGPSLVPRLFSPSTWPGNETIAVPHCKCLAIASFPGLSHLQFLIACSMLKRRGKGWEIESRA